MVVGVTQGYERRLNVIGVGFRAEIQGKNLSLQVGYSHPRVVAPYDGIEFEVGQDTNTRMPFIIMRGIDKEVIGQQAAEIRAIRPPSPYKKPTERMSKGIRYEGEHVRMKAGKAAKAGL
jgi:large subunit ribosomal protein L6